MKEINFFFWLYLTINAPDFWPIPLDCNTYVLSKRTAPATASDHSEVIKSNTVHYVIFSCEKGSIKWAIIIVLNTKEI